jgi:hypothetical protein
MIAAIELEGVFLRIYNTSSGDIMHSILAEYTNGLSPQLRGVVLGNNASD